MYTSFYNLREKPFQISTDPRFLWLGEKHKEALAILKFGLIDQKSFLLLTGDVGTGKTTLVNALLKSLDGDVLVASITDPNLDLLGFLNHIARSFNITRRYHKKEEFLHDFKIFLEDTCASGKYVLLIIDEAHKLSKELLEQARLLSNIELPEKKLITIFFVGQNELNQTLMSYDCRALRQRITLNYNIKALSANETREYIKHRLEIAGTEEPIFSDKAINAIHHFSNGSPRLINILCDRALLTGYVTGQPRISTDVIVECSQEILLPGERQLAPFADLPHPQGAENIPSPVAHPLIKDNTPVFRQNEYEDLPLEGPATTDYGMSGAEKSEAIHEVIRPRPLSGGRPAEQPDSARSRPPQPMAQQGKTDRTYDDMYEGRPEFAWGPEMKRLIKEALAAIPFHAPKRKRLLRGTAAFFIILVTVLFSRNYLVSRADHQAPIPSAPVARIENDKVPPPPVPQVAAPKVAAPTDKNTTAKTGQEADRGKRSSLNQAKEALAGEKFSRAAELLEDAMARREGNQSEIKTLYAQALMGQAQLLSATDIDQTERLLNKAAAADPENGLVYYELGKVHAKKKNYSKAIDAYSKAAELNPDSADTFFNLGSAYAAIDNYADAEKMFQRASELQPAYRDKAIFNLAMVQYKQGKQEQCIKNLERAVKLNPGNQRARTYLERFTGGKQ